MEKCWNDDREVRPTFQELRIEFDDLISNDEEYNYLVIRRATEIYRSGTMASGHLDPTNQLQSMQ